MPRLRCSSTRASVNFRSSALAVRPARCTNPAVTSPYSALPTSHSPSPESSITWLTSREPSSNGSRRSCVSVIFARSEEHTSELQSHHDLVCRLLLEKKKKKKRKKNKKKKKKNKIKKEKKEKK